MTGGGWEIRAETLPGVLAAIADLIGVEPALHLAERWGGRRRYIPTAEQLRRDHPLVGLLGRRRALLVCGQLGGGEVNLPSAKPLRHALRARELRRQGRSHAEIAGELGLGVKRVAELVAGVEPGNGGPVLEEATPTRCALCGRPHPRPRGPRRDPRQLWLPLEPVA